MKAVNINFLYFSKVFNTVSKSKFLNKLSNHDINKFATLSDELAQWQSPKGHSKWGNIWLVAGCGNDSQGSILRPASLYETERCCWQRDFDKLEYWTTINSMFGGPLPGME